jgi:two-component system chemotaxis response regulator CheB
MRTGGTQAVVIGASAGALEALTAVLGLLGADYSLPTIIVTHLPPDRNSVLTELLSTKCKIPVSEAEDKEPILSGQIYFAPPDYHLLIEQDGRFSLSSEELVNYSRPSIDVLFESAAEVYGDRLVGVILSGANHDGASGLSAVIARGGHAIVQDPAEAYASTMPQSALAACPAAEVMSLRRIGEYLSTIGKST